MDVQEAGQTTALEGLEEDRQLLEGEQGEVCLLVQDPAAKRRDAGRAVPHTSAERTPLEAEGDPDNLMAAQHR